MRVKRAQGRIAPIGVQQPCSLRVQPANRSSQNWALFSAFFFSPLLLIYNCILSRAARAARLNRVARSIPIVHFPVNNDGSTAATAWTREGYHFFVAHRRFSYPVLNFRAYAEGVTAGPFPARFLQAFVLRRMPLFARSSVTGTCFSAGRILTVHSSRAGFTYSV